MADTDSFIDEVSEELRRDRLFAFFRKWAWLVILVVVLIVGAAGYIEWQRAQAQATAEAFGNALVTALDAPDAAARIEGLSAVEAPGTDGALLLALLSASEAAGSGDAEGQAAAAQALREAAATPEIPRIYRDLALLKAHLLDPQPAIEARLTLGVLSEPGAPFAALAEEQLALLDVEEGNIEAAIDRLRGLENAAAATPGLQQRAAQLIVALEAGAVLADGAEATPAPSEDAETDPETDE